MAIMFCSSFFRFFSMSERVKPAKKPPTMAWAPIASAIRATSANVMKTALTPPAKTS